MAQKILLDCDPGVDDALAIAYAVGSPQLDLVGLLRPVVRGELSPADAVRAYHEALAKAEIAPWRTLEADLEVTDPVLRAE